MLVGRLRIVVQHGYARSAYERPKLETTLTILSMNVVSYK